MSVRGRISGVPVPPDPPSPRPRRIATPSWLDVRLVLGIALVLAAVLGGAELFAHARRTYPKVAARRDLASGTVLTPDDLTLVRVQLSGAGRGVYVDRVRDAVGRTLARPVAAGELLPAGAVTAVPARTTVTVPLPTGSAPELRQGERIELWASTSACASAVLLPDVVVQAVRPDSGGAFGDGAAGQDVVISVPPTLADRVVQALALDQVRLRAGVLNGPAPHPSALPDLAGCAPAPR
jgi:hypothetical protein